MQPTNNDGSPETSTAPLSGPVWTPEEVEELTRIFAENLREGILQNQAAEKKTPTKGWLNRGKEKGFPQKQ